MAVKDGARGGCAEPRRWVFWEDEREVSGGDDEIVFSKIGVEG